MRCLIEDFEALRSKDRDYLGRPYEDSRYQWMAADYKVASNGSVSIESPYVPRTLLLLFLSTLF